MPRFAHFVRNPEDSVYPEIVVGARPGSPRSSTHCRIRSRPWACFRMRSKQRLYARRVNQVDTALSPRNSDKNREARRKVSWQASIATASSRSMYRQMANTLWWQDRYNFRNSRGSEGRGGEGVPSTRVGYTGSPVAHATSSNRNPRSKDKRASNVPDIDNQVFHSGTSCRILPLGYPGTDWRASIRNADARARILYRAAHQTVGPGI